MGQVSNAELVEKALIDSSAVTTDGKMAPEQADKFIDYVFDVTVMKGHARTIKFKPEQLYIDKIGVGARVAIAATEAADPGLRRGVTTSKVTLQPAEIIVPVEISDTFSEINLEGEDAKEKIVKMMATQFGNDLEDVYINGNQLGIAILESVYKGGSATQHVKDAYMGLMNGWLNLAESGNRVDFSNENINSSIFSRMLNAMPSKFKRNRSRLRFFCAPELEQNYRERVASRATAKGDAAISSSAPLTPFGVPLIPVPLLALAPPIVEHVTVNTDGSTATALKYKNVTSVVVHLATLDKTPTTPYTVGASGDYTLDAANGTITRITTGTNLIGSGASVKVSYNSKARLILTHESNYVVGIGRDVRIERDRDIFKRVDQFVITAKAAVALEESTALVDGYNVGVSLT